MIFEMAQLEIKAGTEAAFEKGVTQALPIFKRARGCQGVKLLKSVEQPLHYTLMITWNTLEDHTVHFRQSADFQEWRKLVGEFFANPPQVGHTQVVVPGF